MINTYEKHRFLTQTFDFNLNFTQIQLFIPNGEMVNETFE